MEPFVFPTKFWPFLFAAQHFFYNLHTNKGFKQLPLFLQIFLLQSCALISTYQGMCAAITHIYTHTHHAYTYTIIIF